MITLDRNEWAFGQYSDGTPEEWKACANYEYAREAKHVRAAYINRGPFRKRQRIHRNRFSLCVDLDGLAGLVPEFPQLPWLTVVKTMNAEQKRNIVHLLARTMPTIMEVPASCLPVHKVGEKLCAYSTELGPWLFDSVCLRLTRNYSDKEIIKAFGEWLQRHPAKPKPKATKRLNLSVRGIGARRDWEALKFLAAKRLFESQGQNEWIREFNRAYATCFNTRQVSKAIFRLNLDFPPP